MRFAEPTFSSDPAPAIPPALLADLPRDQALGLRLIALARAAAALHMAQLPPADEAGATLTEPYGKRGQA